MNRVTAMLFSQNITRRFATIVLDVHDTLQEHSVKPKSIPGYSNEKFKFKNISAICADLAPLRPKLLAGNLVLNIAENPLQNSPQSHLNCLNWYNNSFQGYCKAFWRYVDAES